MNSIDLTNGTSNDLYFAADYPAAMQLDVLRPDDQQALRTRLAELRAPPPEQWADRGVLELGPKLPGKYAVFFGEDGIAWVVPQADGRFRLDGLGSQRTLRAFEREAEAGDGQ